MQDGEVWTFSVRAFESPLPERTINVNYGGFAEGQKHMSHILKLLQHILLLGRCIKSMFSYFCIYFIDRNFFLVLYYDRCESWG